jgi:hypothetical protein
VDTKPLRDVLQTVYPWAEAMIPGLAVYMPRDAVLGILDSVQIGLNKKLDVDVKPFDVIGVMGVVRELTEAALVRTPHERREALYELMKFLTTIEDHMSLEEWMAYADQATLPNEV